MPKVGDRVRLSSGKAPDREGIVTAVTGSILRVRWPSGEESTVVPAPGTLTVLTMPPTARPARAAPKRVAPKKTAAKKTAPKQTAAKQTAPKQTAAKQTAAKKTAAKKTAAKKTATRPRQSSR
jgi:hypothetical protein